MYKYVSLLSVLLISCAVDEASIEESISEPEEDIAEENEPIVEVDPCIPEEGAEGVRLEGTIKYPDGTLRKLLDVKKIKSLGWKPSISLTMGIAKTYNWYKKNV